MRFELSVIACICLTILVSDRSAAFAEDSEPPCPPAVVLSGDPELRASVAFELAMLGVFSENIPPGCPVIRARLEREDERVRVAVVAHGRRARRALTHPSSAAVWIESWARDDLEAPLLAVRATTHLAAPPPARRASPANVERALPRPAVRPESRHVFTSAVETLSASDSSSWRALRVAGCSAVGPACIGAALRLADNNGFSHNDDLSAVDRRAIDAQVRIAVPIEVGMATLEPSLGLGVGWLDTRRAAGNPECQPAPDGTCEEIAPPFTIDDGFTRSSFEPHIEARLTMSFVVTRWLSVDLAGAIVLRPTASTRAVLPAELPPSDDPADPNNDGNDPDNPNEPGPPPLPIEAYELPGEPTRALGVGVGLRIFAVMTKQREGLLLPLRRVDGETREMSDDALVAAIAVGERAALGALFDRHQAAVFRFVSRLVGAHSSEVEDLVQCTFVEAWRSADRFRKQGRALSWLFGIAANLSRHHMRSQARRRTAMDRLAEAPACAAKRPDDDAETRQLLDQLRSALDDLPHHLRVAFVLCDLEQVPGVEAARALGVREGTMWRRIHQARKALREALDGGIA